MGKLIVAMIALLRRRKQQDASYRTWSSHFGLCAAVSLATLLSMNLALGSSNEHWPAEFGDRQSPFITTFGRLITS
jgi:hypothetical protein